MDSNYCREVQFFLKTKEYYNGKIDGFCGPGFRRAIRNFKKVSSLSINDMWTPEAEKLAEAAGYATVNIFYGTDRKSYQ